MAEGHPDVEIRTGAAHTHEELLEIAGWLGDRTGITREWEIYCMIQSVGVNMPANGIYIVINLRFDGTPESTGVCLENREWSSNDEAIKAKRKEVADFLRDRIDVPIEVRIASGDRPDPG